MQLSKALDLAHPKATYQRDRRVMIPEFLEADAARSIVTAAGKIRTWMLVTFLAGRHVTLDAAEMERVEETRHREFNQHVVDGARRGFQYLYDAWPVYGKWHAGTLAEEAPILARLFEFLNGDEFLGAMRRILGVEDIGFVDAQLTRYRPGHFLTPHDDSVDKGDRVAAYVLNLSDGWQPDWGGHLHFLDGQGGVTASFVPRMNALALFEVPQQHTVSLVAPWAGQSRISITGWLRRGSDPGPDGVG